MKQVYLPNSNAQVRTFRRALLTGVETTILDEIHAVVGNRRGVHLITAVDRLVRLSGEFQRIALSATVRPLEKVAEFIGGLQVTGASGQEQGGGECGEAYHEVRLELVRKWISMYFAVR